MGRLVDGKWLTTDLGADERGRFVRRAAKFRGRVSSGSPFEPATGRYHLYVSAACGWSHRVLMTRQLLGLESCLPVTFADAFMGEQGWVFPASETTPTEPHEPSGLVPPGFVPPGYVPHQGPLFELYVRHQADYTGRVSVPVLWDKQRSCIVTNESADLVQDLNSAFAQFSSDPVAASKLDLYPTGEQQRIEAMILANYGPINNGVYRAGFAGKQSAHEEAVRAVP